MESRTHYKTESIKMNVAAARIMSEKYADDAELATFADAVGVPLETVQAWEARTTLPTEEQMASIAHVCGVSVRYLERPKFQFEQAYHDWKLAPWYPSEDDEKEMGASPPLNPPYYGKTATEHEVPFGSVVRISIEYGKGTRVVSHTMESV